MTKVHAPRGAVVNTTWKDTPTKTINGGVFQYHQEFVAEVLEFLER